jgi:hypothetical protein
MLDDFIECAKAVNYGFDFSMIPVYNTAERLIPTGVLTVNSQTKKTGCEVEREFYH